MDFIRISKKHSFWGSFFHLLFNIILAVIVWLSIVITKSPLIAIILIMASKWRTFAVRPRFWAVNIKSNLVDLIFSLSIAILMYAIAYSNAYVNVTNNSILQICFVVIYILWLTFIKPRSDELFMKIQALLSVFFGFTTIFTVGYNWGELIIVIASFIVGYASLRHILSINSSKDIEILSLFWGLIIAEISWFSNFLVIAYPIQISNIFNFAIPQVSIIVSALSFTAFEFFLPKKDNKEKKFSDILPAVIFSTVLILMLLIFFSSIPKIA